MEPTTTIVMVVAMAAQDLAVALICKVVPELVMPMVEGMVKLVQAVAVILVGHRAKLVQSVPEIFQVLLVPVQLVIVAMTAAQATMAMQVSVLFMHFNKVKTCQ
jgi:hypothetical protein